MSGGEPHPTTLVCRGPDPGAELAAQDSKPANEVSPESVPVPAPGRSPSASACEPYFDFIDLSLSKRRNAKAIYQDLVDDHAFTGHYQSVKRFVRRLRGQPALQACPVIVTPPGNPKLTSERLNHR